MCSIGDWPCGPVPIFASRYRSQHRGLALAACPRLLRRIQARGYSPARFALKPRYEQVTSTLIASAAVPPRDRQQVPVPDAQKPVDLAASGTGPTGLSPFSTAIFLSIGDWPCGPVPVFYAASKPVDTAPRASRS